MSSRRIYGRDVLLQLRDSQAKIARKTRSVLWYYKLLLPSPSSPPCLSLDSFPSSALQNYHNPIPVRVTKRNRPSSLSYPSNKYFGSTINTSNLIKIRCVNAPRKPRSRSNLSSPSVLYFNARSLKNKIDELNTRCKQKQHNPDLIVITETWLDHSIPDSFLSVPGYNILRCDRDSNGGGVAFYFKSSIPYDHIPLPATTTEFKSNILCCRLPEFSAILYGIYHPYWANAQEHQLVLNYLQDSFDTTLNTFGSRHQLVLCGDVNGIFSHLTPFLNCNNLTQLINFNTRGNNTLDIFASSAPGTLFQPIPLSPLGRSDHIGFFISSHSKSTLSVKKVKARDFGKKNQAKFLSLLLNIDWSHVLRHTSVDAAIVSFNATVSSIFDSCFPEKSVRMRSDDPPWITPSIKVILDKMDRAFFKDHALFLHLRDLYLRKTNAAKAKFSQSLFAKAHSSKDKWRAINRLCKSKRNQTSISDDLADQLNFKFANHFRADADLSPDLQVLLGAASHMDFRFSDFSVFKELKKIRSSSCGHDKISGWIFKCFAHEFASPLTTIFNRCLEACYFPDVWKKANILPLPKGRSDFRPISLLPCASKVLERLFLRYILLPSLNTPFNRYQFGFVPSVSGGCCNAVTYTRLKILQHLALTNGYVRMIQIDFTKAFDRASHALIVSTLLEKFRCSPSIVKFIHSFLSNRWQRVLSSNGHSSPWTHVTSGVPQGSVLGPLLFVTMINEFPSLSDNSKLLAYADDIILLHLVDNFHYDNIRSDVLTVLDWASSLKLSVNLDKFKSITFSRDRSGIFPPPIVINSFQIPEVNDIKFLGVTLQNDTKWDRHLNSALRKASRNMFLVKILWLRKAPSHVIWQAYLSFVFGSFCYCWPSLCDIPPSALRKFLTLEKRASNWASRPFSEKDALSRLDCICVRLILKVAKDHNTHPLAEFFSVRPPNSSLRHTRALQLPNHVRKAFYSKTFIKYSSFT